jgi:CBS domain-containing protein
MMDQVCEYMVKSVREIDSEASVLDAAEKLSSLGIGSLLVKRGDEYVGMITEQEITRQLVAKSLDPNDTNTGDIMNPDIDYISEKETMSQAIAIMREKKLRYLIVRDGQTVTGILSVKDLLAFYEKWFALIL